MQIDIRAMELLASRLCHDLVSPVSAINNGVELVQDIGGTVVDEAMKLIGDSAVHAAHRLRLFRASYGRAGGEENFPIRDARHIAEQYLAGGKVNLTWPEDQPSEEFAAHRGVLKVMLNMLIMSEEILAYGGTVTVRSVPNGSRFEIAGRNAQVNPTIEAALAGTTGVEELTPRSIQAYITGKFAAHFELKLTHEQPVTDRLDMILATA